MSLKIITASEVNQLLPMESCIDVMAQAMRAISAGKTDFPKRTFPSLADGSGALGVMPGFLESPGVYGAKLISLHPDNPSLGMPTIQGFVALFDRSNGTPIALVEGSSITAIRTAAVSGLATRELSNTAARSHGVFGTGVQSRTHIQAIACVRQIERVVVWGRNFEKTKKFVSEESSKYDFEIVAAQNPQDAAACDVVSTVTASQTPVLFSEWISPGTHLNIAGAHTADSREVDGALVAKSQVYFDVRSAALSEAGDLLIPIQEGLTNSEDWIGELGQVLLREIPARTNSQQITLYKSLGTVAQDLYAAEFVWRAAQQSESGVDVELT